MKKPRERTERRVVERAMRNNVRDREKLIRKLPGGAEANPIEVASSSVIEPRVESTPCPQCAGDLRVRAHRATASGKRAIDATCQRCHVTRTIWFDIVGVVTGPN